MLLEELLTEVFKRKASDLHLTPGMPPVFRIHGHLIRGEFAPMSTEECHRMLFSMLNSEQRRTLEQNWEIDFSYGVESVGRFRVNIYKSNGKYSAALRAVHSIVPTFDDLGLPDICQKIAQRPRGLVLVTGPTGSGKSTTLAAMLDWINNTFAHHILTVEDPIEYVHMSKKSVIHQRELGQDTHSFANALKSALREDPDIILVGEMRDLETISLAITAAETGHLVFGTLHTSSAITTVDRIVDVFPPEQQTQIRVQLSNSLLAVFSQNLLPKLGQDGKVAGRALAQEIMIVTPAIANLIREGKTAQMYSSIQTGSRNGMQTMEMALKYLYDKNWVTYEDAISRAVRVDDFKRLVEGHSASLV